MDIQDLGAIGEFISSVAIVITLIFLTTETRRARNATQQSNRQARHRMMSKIDNGGDEVTVTASDGNIFADLGLADGTNCRPRPC